MQSVVLHQPVQIVSGEKESDRAAKKEYLDKVMRGVGDACPEQVQFFEDMLDGLAYSVM